VRGDTEPLASCVTGGEAVTGGHIDGVPHLDRWLHAAYLVERYESFNDMDKPIATAAVGSMLSQGKSSAFSDSSRKVARQLVTTLTEPLRWRDFEIMANATCSSIGIDECDSVLLVYARCYVRRAQEVYDFLLGLIEDHGTGPENCRKGIESILRNACTMKEGVKGENGRKQIQKHFCKKVYDRFRKSVCSAVADGGPTEQRALFDFSSIALVPANAADPLFPKLQDINRDRARKRRSIQKGSWSALHEDLCFFDELVTGEQSFARMLQTSSKYRLLFQDLQFNDSPAPQCTTLSRMKTYL